MCQSSEENLGFRYQYWNLMSYSVWVEENLTKHSSNTLMHLVRFIATQTFYSWCVINSEKWNFTIQKLPIFWRFWPLDQAGSWQIFNMIFFFEFLQIPSKNSNFSTYLGCPHYVWMRKSELSPGKKNWDTELPLNSVWKIKTP